MSFPQLRSPRSGINPLSKAQELTLTADRGFYDWTGSAAGTYHGYPIVAASGSFSWTGTAASLRSGEVLVASSGTVNWTGTVAALKVGFVVSAQSGSVAWTGTDAVLNYSANPPASSLNQTHLKRKNYPRAFSPAVFGKRRFEFVNSYRLDAQNGQYDWTGQDINLVYAPIQTTLSRRDKRARAWPRPFAPGPFSHLTTQRSVNRIGYATTSYALIADPGAFIETGSAVTFLVGHIVAATSGVYSWNVNPVTFEKGFTLLATPGAWTWAGTDITPRVSMPADSGAWTITGTEVFLFYSNAGTTRGGMLLMGMG